jgi:hypothetical protein
MTARTNQKRAQYVAQGRCKACPNPQAPNRRYCQECLDKAKKAAKRDRTIVRRCKQCGAGPLERYYSLCGKCRQTMKNKSTNAWWNRMVAGGICPSCCKPTDRAGRVFCARCALKQKAWGDRTKRACIDAYGGRCACCGETELSWLSLDHVNNDGAERRRSGVYPGAGCGRELYRWLVKNGFPKDHGLAVLRMNCQFGKRLCGVCPHQLRGVVNGGGEGI